MIYPVGLIEENYGKNLPLLVLQHHPQITGHLAAIPDNGLLQGPNTVSAPAQFQGGQDNYGFYLSYPIQFQQVMDLQAAQFIEVVFYGSQQLFGQIYRIFIPGTLSDQYGQQFGIRQAIGGFTK